MDLEHFLFFFISTFTLIMVPGPAAITVITQGASPHGRYTPLTILGVACGDGLYFLLSATGIASLILASEWVFNLMKWLGIAYLLYLGLTALLSKTGAIKVNSGSPRASAFHAYSKGLLVELSNPKALMYVSALLPQFVDPDRPVMMQMLVMGGTCMLADLIVYSFYGKLGSHLAQGTITGGWVSLINKVAGIALLVTALKMALFD